MGKMITVKIGKLPGRVSEYTLDEGSTIGQALLLAEIEQAIGEEIRLNGVMVTPSKSLGDGDVIHLVKQVKGN